jgi:dihydrofolate reductase
VTRLALVAAVAANGVIGRDGALPWHLPDDLRHFRAVTLGKPVLMGRRTFESIGRPLPGRRNIVLSRGAAITVPGIETAATLQEALRRCADAEECCVIGGAALYAAALPLAQVIYLTRVHAAVAGDVHFPAVRWEDWRESARRDHAADERHAHAMSFLTLERIGAGS